MRVHEGRSLQSHIAVGHVTDAHLPSPEKAGQRIGMGACHPAFYARLLHRYC
jgi:hypothetical protein